MDYIILLDPEKQLETCRGFVGLLRGLEKDTRQPAYPWLVCGPLDKATRSIQSAA